VKDEVPEVVEMLFAVAELLGHRRTFDPQSRADEHAAGFAGRVDIDGLDELSVLHVPSPLCGPQSTTSLPVTCCVFMSPSSSVRVRAALT
jgi:hypothetical protein